MLCQSLARLLAFESSPELNCLRRLRLPWSPTQRLTTGAVSMRRCCDVVNSSGAVVSSSQADLAVPRSTSVPSPAFKTTHYKRVLPSPPCIDFSGHEGKQLFQEALAAGYMNGFFKLIQQFTTQAEPAFCGISSLVQVMNALEVDPKRIWKGAWRWYSEDMLDCCKPLHEIEKEGITLDQAACLGSCNGANVQMFRHGTFSYAEFKQAVERSTSLGTEHLVVSYSRRALSQTGDGHFSPVGGYHPSKELVLILDTARFKYPPHWVPLRTLFDAMASVDTATGLPRGYLRLWPRARQHSVMFTLSIKGAWHAAHAFAVSGAGVIVRDAATNAAHYGSAPLDHCGASESSSVAAGHDRREGGVAPLADGAVHQLIAAIVAAMPIDSVLSMLQVRRIETMCNQQMERAHTQLRHELRHLDVFPAVAAACAHVNVAQKYSQSSSSFMEQSPHTAPGRLGGSPLFDRGIVQQPAADDALSADSSAAHEARLGSGGSEECKAEAAAQLALSNVQPMAARPYARLRTQPAAHSARGQAGLRAPAMHSAASGADGYSAQSLCGLAHDGADGAPSSESPDNATTSVPGLSAESLERTHRLVPEICTAYLLLCRQSISQAVDELLATQQPASDTGRTRALRALPALLQTGGPSRGSSLVEDEISSLEQQLGKLVLLDGDTERADSVDSFDRACRHCADV